MRRNGSSINDISENLNVPKSTISIWCRDISLTASQIATLEKKQRDRAISGSLRAAENKRNIRIQTTVIHKRSGALDVGEISKRDLFILGMGLYWGEGYKRGNNELGFTNSDPDIIRVFIAWMHQIYGIQTADFILRLSLNTAYRSSESKIIEYWSDITHTKVSQFTKTSFIKTRLKKYDKKSHGAYFGTLRIKIRRATNLHRRILGSLEYLAQTAHATESAQTLETRSHTSR